MPWSEAHFLEYGPDLVYLCLACVYMFAGVLSCTQTGVTVDDVPSVVAVPMPRPSAVEATVQEITDNGEGERTLKVTLAVVRSARPTALRAACLRANALRCYIAQTVVLGVGGLTVAR